MKCTHLAAIALIAGSLANFPHHVAYPVRLTSVWKNMGQGGLTINATPNEIYHMGIDYIDPNTVWENVDGQGPIETRQTPGSGSYDVIVGNDIIGDPNNPSLSHVLIGDGVQISPHTLICNLGGVCIINDPEPFVPFGFFRDKFKSNDTIGMGEYLLKDA